MATDSGDPESGRQIFRACSSCHSLTPGRHMTGPSLASIWGRTAGTVEGFTRYSDALEQSRIVWDERSLDAWLKDPRAFLPGNRMTFRGLPDQAQRRDLIAFLHQRSQHETSLTNQQTAGTEEKAMGQGEMADLKVLDANNRIASISHCRDTYTVVSEAGQAQEFWEFNLRFKTDGSENGPLPDHPVIIPSGMRGDRAFVVFALPAEISRFIRKGC